MPEFILEIGQPADWQNWNALDSFTQGYIQAMFFTNEGSGDSEEWETPEYQHRMMEGQTDGDLPNDVGFSDLAPDTLREIIAECKSFQAMYPELLDKAYGMTMGNGLPYGENQAGIDFWFTRNGHGAGFWDRGLGDVGDALGDCCGHGTEFSELNPFYQGGKVYL